MNLSFSTATQADAPALAALHTAVAEDLTRRFGRGPWSAATSERGIAFWHAALARRDRAEGQRYRGNAAPAYQKAMAIDVSYFTRQRNRST